MNKKGIQPLLATGMLIGLAMCLGIVVMNFGRAQVETDNKCESGIGLNWLNLDNKEQVCLNKNVPELYFIAENNHEQDIDGVRLRAIGEKSIFASDLEQSAVKKSDALMKHVPYDLAQYGSVRQLKLTPKVKLYDEEVVCTDQALLAENPRDC